MVHTCCSLMRSVARRHNHRRCTHSDPKSFQELPWSETLAAFSRHVSAAAYSRPRERCRSSQEHLLACGQILLIHQGQLKVEWATGYFAVYISTALLHQRSILKRQTAQLKIFRHCCGLTSWYASFTFFRNELKMVAKTYQAK